MDQINEVAIITALVGWSAGYMTNEVFQAILLAFGLTRITSTITAHYSQTIYTLLEQT